jgi:hypothetical protein
MIEIPEEDALRSYTKDEEQRLTSNLAALTVSVHEGRYSAERLSVQLFRICTLRCLTEFATTLESTETVESEPSISSSAQTAQHIAMMCQDC